MADLRERLQEALAGRYQLEHELGRGGMATVYLARDLRHDRQVALKVMHPELASSIGPERFLHEVRTTARLQHPHILPVHDSGETAGMLWYVMPYVEGESLRQRLQREQQLPIEDALQITREVADALGYAHSQGIVHRDIKPENILLTRGHALVADFGIARAVQAGGGQRLTETGVAIGTPAYMSPEQCLASPSLDGRSDLYSLGCVLYEMLVGEAPYTGTSPQAITAKRLMDAVPSARRLRDTVPAPIDQAVMRLLAKMPADRFPDGASLGRALSTGGPAQVETSPTRAQTRIRNAARVAAFLLGVAVLALGALNLFHSPHSPSSQRKMLAVLPFTNLGAADEQYFADGLTEEITSRLASLHDLGVVSRTSTERYRATTKPLRQVGSELGVNYVLEGSVRWERLPNGANRIRVTPQLIQVNDDVHLWADRYDADLADVFAVQTQIAEQVTNALGMALAPQEREAVEIKPTSNLNAYDAYLRGNAANPPDFTVGAERIVQGFRSAVGYYREAVRLDPTFAPAYSRLGSALMWLALYQVDAVDNSRLAEEAIGRALSLAPKLSEAHGTAGMYYAFISHDMVRAQQEFDKALALRPNDADVLSTIADFEWYIRGPAGRSIAFAERAMTLDPGSNQKALVLARIYRDAGRYDDAERLYDRVIGRDPSSNGPYIMRAYLYLLRDGDTARARATIRAAVAHVDSTALVTAAVSTQGIGTWAAFGMLDQPLQRALLALQPSAFGDDTSFYGIVKGYAYRVRGEGKASQALYDSAQTIALRHRQALPGDPTPLWILMWTRAVHGQGQAAYATFDSAYREQGVTYTPEKNAMLARVAIFAGDTARALSELETRRWGSELTVPWLCTDEFWNPIRLTRRFRRLVDGRC